MIMSADSEGTDQTVRMHRLIWTFALRICPETRIRLPMPKWYNNTLSFINDKRDNFDFVNFPVWDGDAPRATLNGARICLDHVNLF